jgi:hypothetical protein
METGNCPVRIFPATVLTDGGKGMPAYEDELFGHRKDAAAGVCGRKGTIDAPMVP